MKCSFAFPALLYLFVLLHHPLQAHNYSIEGYVYDAATNLPLEGAVVSVKEPSIQTTTNSLGGYYFKDLPKGRYNISITFLGYDDEEIIVDVLDGSYATSETFLYLSDISLKDVLVSADAGNEANSIRSLDIKLRPIESTQDILRLVPGLFIAQHAGGGKAEQIFLRGFDIDHGTDINIQVDDIPVNMVSHAHGQGYADLHFVIPETISNVDFQKGPYNVQYGDFTTAGYVNFHTLDALDKSSIKISAGQFNTFRTLAMFDLMHNKTNAAYIAAEYLLQDGPFISPQDLQKINLFGKYHTRLAEDAILSFTISTFKSQWNASGQIPQRAVDSGFIDRFGAIDDGEGGFTGRTNASIEYIKLLNASSAFRNKLYYSRYDFELYSNFTFYLEDSIYGDEIKQKEKRNIFGYSGSYSSEKTLAFGTILHDLGIGFRNDQIINNELSHTYERNLTLGYLALGNVFETNLNAFVGETLRFHDVSIQAGVRFDQFIFAYDNLLDTGYNYASDNDGILSVKLNFDYLLNDKTVFYLYSGSGFHSNDARVVIPQNATETLPKAYGIDLGMKLKLSNRIVLQPALWMLYLEQEFVYVGDAGIVEPSGKTLRKGVDLSTRIQLANWLFFDADVNYTIAEVLGEEEGNNYIPLAPVFTSIGGISVKAQNGFHGSLRYRMMSDRPANEAGTVTAEGYFVNDLVVSYVGKPFSGGIEIQNLLNTEWNEAQFDTESQLMFETEPVSELHFTPGVPFYAKAFVSFSF